MERSGNGHSVPDLERTEHPHPARNFVCSLAPNRRWILLHGLDMWVTNERTTTESQHARGSATVIHTTNWCEEEQERETV